MWHRWNMIIVEFHIEFFFLSTAVAYNKKKVEEKKQIDFWGVRNWWRTFLLEIQKERNKKDNSIFVVNFSDSTGLDLVFCDYRRNRNWIFFPRLISISGIHCIAHNFLFGSDFWFAFFRIVDLRRRGRNSIEIKKRERKKKIESRSETKFLVEKRQSFSILHWKVEEN